MAVRMMKEQATRIWRDARWTDQRRDIRLQHSAVLLRRRVATSCS